MSNGAHACMSISTHWRIWLWLQSWDRWYVRFSKIFQYSYSGQGNRIIYIFYSEDDQRKYYLTCLVLLYNIATNPVHSQNLLLNISSKEENYNYRNLPTTIINWSTFSWIGHPDFNLCLERSHWLFHFNVAVDVRELLNTRLDKPSFLIFFV